MLRSFRTIAIVEACTYLVLLGAVLARALGAVDLVPVIGPVHGVLFLAYAALALRVRRLLRWPPDRTLWVIGAAAFPLGSVVAAERWAHDESPQLDGHRTTD